MKRTHQISSTVALFLSSSLMTIAHADGARDWENIPINTNIIFAYYTYSNSEVAIDPSLPIEGLSIDAHVPILRYARSFDLMGNVGGIQLVAPFGRITGRIDGTNLKTSASGLSDVAVVFIGNIFGAPALTKKEFANWKAQPYLTGSLSVTVPTGDYDGDQLLNMGKNRWTFKPQLSYGYYFNDATLLSINSNVQLFTDNDEYKSTSNLAQKPLYGIETHLSHNISPKIWLAASGFYSYGGETKVNDVDQDNIQKTLKLGVSGSYNINSVTAVNVSFNRSVAKQSYTPAATNFSININRVF